jgi:hypothetical protein
MSCVRTRVQASGKSVAREQGHLIGRASSGLGVVLPCRQLGLAMNIAWVWRCVKNIAGWVGSGPSDPRLTDATIGHAGTRRLVKVVKLEKEDTLHSNPEISYSQPPVVTSQLTRREHAPMNCPLSNSPGGVLPSGLWIWQAPPCRRSSIRGRPKGLVMLETTLPIISVDRSGGGTLETFEHHAERDDCLGCRGALLRLASGDI